MTTPEVEDRATANPVSDAFVFLERPEDDLAHSSRFGWRYG
jgi:hypothetical protein